MDAGTQAPESQLVLAYGISLPCSITTAPKKCWYYHDHFTGEQTDTERISNLSRVVQASIFRHYDFKEEGKKPQVEEGAQGGWERPQRLNMVGSVEE